MTKLGLIITSGFALFVACATSGGPPAPKSVVVTDSDAEVPVDPTPALASSRVAEPAPREEWTPLVGVSAECARCLPSARGPCGAKRDACFANPECVAYLECARGCPPPTTVDADGGYPQADCVIACRDQHASGADLGDAHLWCVCCDSACKTSCQRECGHFKSGIAGPIGAGCD